MREQLATRHSRANKALYYYFLAIVIWAPLPLASNRDWSTKLLAGLLLSAFAWAVALLLTNNMQITQVLRRAWPAWASLIAVQVWVALQLLLGISVYPPATKLALLLGCGLTAAFVLVLLLIDSRKRIKQLAGIMVLCGVFQAFFGGFMVLSGLEYTFFMEKVDHIGSATGTFMNRNHLAGFLEMNLAIGIGLLLSELHKHPAANWREWWRRTIDSILSGKFRLRLYLAIMVIGLVLTHSRMGNTAFFTSLILCGLLSMVLQRKATRNALLLFASLLIIDAFIVGNWFGIDKVVDRIQGTSLETIKRDEVARDTVRMWQDHFWLGTGADTFAPIYLTKYKSPDSLYYRHAHNDYLELGSTFGMVGFFLLSIPVLTGFWQACKAQYQQNSRLLRGLGFGSAMGIVSILVHSLTDFNLHITSNAFWFAMVLALAWISMYLPKMR